MQIQRPSLIRVIFVDYLSLISIMFPLVLWVFCAYFFVKQDNILEAFVGFSITTSMIGFPLFIWRYRVISSVFEDGIESQGLITNIFFFRDRGRVDYSYIFQGQKYTCGNAIHKSRYTRDMIIGQQVTVFVDRNNPKRAFICELYL